MRGNLYERNVAKAIQRAKIARWELAYNKALTYGHSHNEADAVANTATLLEENGIYPEKAIRLALEIHYHVPRKLV